MAVDRSRLAAALAYKQAEEQRRRQLLESVPLPADAVAGETPRQTDFGTNLENLSIGLGRGLQGQLEGIKGIVTDPVGSARSVYEAGKAVVRDPAIVAQMLREMGQKATSGPLGAGEVIGEMIGPRKTGPVMAELDVYHGTPHRFPATEANPLGEFDASKIGTGEGAQAYGHGIYLAESPGVAESYKQMSPQMLPVGKYAPDEESAYYAARVVRQMGSPEKAIEKLAGTGKSQEFVKAIKDGSYKRFYDELPQASLYKADLPDEMIDRMLDWDKPLSQQPKEVRDALFYIEETHGKIFDESPETGAGWSHVTGGQALAIMKNRLGKFGKGNAEQILQRVGIPGIKYADAGSRGKSGTGTRNFVVFPGEEKKVRILERK